MNGMVDMSRSQHRDTNSPRDHPAQGKRFYAIDVREDGLVDVYLAPVCITHNAETGAREFDVPVRVVRGVEPWPELEEDVRRRYDAWCDSGEEINL